MKYILEIGNFEDLALAELMAKLGEDSLKYLNGRYVYVESDEVLDQNWLNKVGSVISVFEILSVAKEKTEVEKVIDVFLNDAEENIFGKGHLFFESNYYDFKDRRRVLTESKKLLAKNNIKVKFRSNWSTAGMWADGWPENCLAIKALKFRAEYFVLKQVAVQDINTYSERDAGKPYRDAVLGMLPPKLAQSMINIGVMGSKVDVLMDPFCGTGTVLIEGKLMGLKVKGSDIQQVNVKGSMENLGKFFEDETEIFKADARSLKNEDVEGVDLFVTEGYLGTPKRGSEEYEDMIKESREIERLASEFLKNLTEKKSDEAFVVVMCLPVFNARSRDRKIFMKKIVEKVEELGYIVSTLLPKKLLRGNKDVHSIVYGRDDQFVYRQIYRLEYNPG